MKLYSDETQSTIYLAAGYNGPSERSVLGLKAVDELRRGTTSSSVPVLRSFDGSVCPHR